TDSLRPLQAQRAGASPYLGIPSPEVTVSICRVPSPEFSQAPWNIHPVHLCRFAVRARETEAERLFLELLPISLGPIVLSSHTLELRARICLSAFHSAATAPSNTPMTCRTPSPHRIPRRCWHT